MSPKDARKQMVRRLKESGVIGSDKVARAMELVERHLFPAYQTWSTRRIWTHRCRSVRGRPFPHRTWSP